MLGDVEAPLFDGQTASLLVVSLPVVLAVTGLVTARERVHTFLVVVASAATLVNFARLLAS